MTIVNVTNLKTTRRIPSLTSNPDEKYEYVPVTLVELGEMAYDIGLSDDDFCDKLIEYLRRPEPRGFNTEIDTIISFELVLYSGDEVEPFFKEHIVLKMASLGSMVIKALDERKSVKDVYVEGVIRILEEEAAKYA